MPLLSGHDERGVAQAAQRLADGELVGFPTETVYGLGARADDDAAVRRIFEAKGRPSEHPLIVHVADAAGAERFAAALSPVARRLMQAFWPGPLTVIVPRRDGVATAAAGGQDSIGLRCPAHPVAHALLLAAAERGVAGVAGPSANRFGRISPTTAEHVRQEFGDGLTVLDGGACDVGIESTIIDCTRDVPVLLRPGVLSRDAIEAVLGQPLMAADAGAPRASGTLAAHYAPNAKLVLLDAEDLRRALACEMPKGLAVYSRTVLAAEAGGAAMHRQMPLDAALAAQELFAVLREFDARSAQLIWVEQPPDSPEWDGVRDRLQRAAAA
jgi:L-threonylcarbamoyladenylate synthase